MKKAEYDALIAREAAHWGAVAGGGEDPQIWDDRRLFEIFYGREYSHFLNRAAERGGRILELGCGNGGTALVLAERGLTVTGIDLSPERIARAASDAARRNLSGTTAFQVGDLNLMHLPRAGFDCVIAHDSLHHILELGSLLDRVRVALVPGGRLVVMDFVGMGTMRKLIAAAMFALLPTHRSYRSKWGLRGRMESFLAPERRKRRAVSEGSAQFLHSGSPFEEISGPSIPAEIAARFCVEESFTFCPFWYYLAPKLKLPAPVKYPVARALHACDEGMLRVFPRGGAHIFITASHD